MLNHLSLATVPIETFSETGVSIESGTAFFYAQSDGVVWLVTNWHLLTNRSPVSPRHSKTGAVPTRATIKLHKRQPNGGITLQDKWQFSFDINASDGEAPRWFEHPHYRYKFDVVALPFRADISPLSVSHYFVAADYPAFVPEFEPEVMMDVFVLGYPWGIHGGDKVLPIYKRGSVASEPEIDHGELPRFLVDCRTAPGMSGAPVIASYSGLWSPPHLKGDSKIGTVQNLAGCYSGRLQSETDTTARDDVTEIGIVWKRVGIDAIIRRGVPGTKLSELVAGPPLDAAT